jgi:putative transposase
MARSLRGDTSRGDSYHIISDCNRKAKELRNKKTKNMFLQVMYEAKYEKGYQFELHTFTIIDTHFHLEITPEKGQSLSTIMKWVKQVFAHRWNKEHNTSGHFWGDRFWSRKITSDVDFWLVFDYINNNAVKAGLVKKPEDWEWGGLYHLQHGITHIVTPVTPEFWQRFTGEILRLGVCP